MPEEEEEEMSESGRNIFYKIVPEKELIQLYDKLYKEDKQSAELLVEVVQKLQEHLNISREAEAALSRVMLTVNRGPKWDASLIRNNVFKAANSLEMDLPSHMF
jgi:hypothetical protein